MHALAIQSECVLAPRLPSLLKVQTLQPHRSNRNCSNHPSLAYRTLDLGIISQAYVDLAIAIEWKPEIRPVASAACAWGTSADTGQ